MKAIDVLNEALLQEEVYKLSSTQLNLPPAHADYVIKWGREMIPDEALYYDDKGGCGRELEPHISVLYGLTEPEPSKKLLELVRKTPPFVVHLGAVTLFENEKFDVVKFDVDSDELVALSKALRVACPNENKYPDYVPHCTVAYVKKGQVPDLAGNYPFEQNPPIPADFEVNEILFKPAGESKDPNRKVVRIPLNRNVSEAEDPASVLKSAKREDCVIYCRNWGHTLFMAIEMKPYRGSSYETYRWVSAPELATHMSRRVAKAYREQFCPGEEGRRVHIGTWAFVKKYVLEAEDPKAALQLPQIKRPLRFEQVPEGFYFRTPYYALVKKETNTEVGTNAITTDLDAVRPLRMPDNAWCFPVKFSVNDITSGRGVPWWALEGRKSVYEGLDEAEDPKEVFRRAVAGAPAFYLTRDKDAYGKALNQRQYLYVRKAAEGLSGTWTPYRRLASQFRSIDDCWEVMKRLWGDDLSYWEGMLRPERLLGFEKERSRTFRAVGESEDPKAALRVNFRKHFGKVTIRWADQYGREHSTSFWEVPPHRAKEELEANLKAAGSPHIVRQVIEVTQELGEASPKGQEGPFDKLPFPTDPSVLVSKLLDLELASARQAFL